MNARTQAGIRRRQRLRLAGRYWQLYLLILPLTALVVIFISLPIKVYAFATMNKQGWLTRHAGQVGGDGQDEASLRSSRSAAPVPPAPLPGRAPEGILASRAEVHA